MVVEWRKSAKGDRSGFAGLRGLEMYWVEWGSLGHSAYLQTSSLAGFQIFPGECDPIRIQAVRNERMGMLVTSDAVT